MQTPSSLFLAIAVVFVTLAPVPYIKAQSPGSITSAIDGTAAALVAQSNIVTNLGSLTGGLAATVIPTVLSTVTNSIQQLESTLTTTSQQTANNDNPEQIVAALTSFVSTAQSYLSATVQQQSVLSEFGLTELTEASLETLETPINNIGTSLSGLVPSLQGNITSQMALLNQALGSAIDIFS